MQDNSRYLYWQTILIIILFCYPILCVSNCWPIWYFIIPFLSWLHLINSYIKFMILSRDYNNMNNVIMWSTVTETVSALYIVAGCYVSDSAAVAVSLPCSGAGRSGGDLPQRWLLVSLRHWGQGEGNQGTGPWSSAPWPHVYIWLACVRK